MGIGMGRRTLVLSAAGLASGCSLWDDWFGAPDKPPLPGKREAISRPRHGLEPPGRQNVPLTMPPTVANADWPQAGGNPAHNMGHLTASDRPSRVWSVDIGEGGGYRAKITAQPVVAGGAVFAMDSDGVVSAFDLGSGSRRWRVSTQAEDDRSFNVGGGLAVDGSLVYASTGRAEVLALAVSDGAINWRQPLPAPARSAPTIADGRIFINTIDGQLVAHALDDGHRLWAYRASGEVTGMLGQPAPTVSGPFVVAGFPSGEIVALRAATGGVAWSDSLAASRGRGSLADLSSLRGRPVADESRVYAISLGGQMVAFDLRSGLRLWEKEVSSEESIWAAGEWLFIVTVEQQIAAINRADGHAGWVSDLPRYGDPEKQTHPIFWRGPVLASDRLILGGTNEQATAVSPYTGEILGTQELSGAASVAPVVASATILLVTDDATLLALR
jgi:outer membrane protein assembly factor BamB